MKAQNTSPLIIDLLLEKNSFLEGFIQDDLGPALTQAIPVLQHLLAERTAGLTEAQKRDIAGLKSVVSRLNNLAQETTQVSEALDTEFERVINDKHKDNGYANLAQPIRLKKNYKDKMKPPRFEGDNNKVSSVANPEKHNQTRPSSTTPLTVALRVQAQRASDHSMKPTQPP